MHRFLAAALLLGAAGCRTDTLQTCPTRTSRSAEAEALAGRRAAPALEMRFGGVSRDQAAEQRMHRVAERIARSSDDVRGPFRCRLLASDRRNAACLPGGRLYVTRGLYAKLETDAQLAAVLAHELAHLAADDCFKPRCRYPDEALERELATDRAALAYLTAAGFAPEILIHVVHLVKDAQPPSWVTARIRNINHRIAESANVNLAAAGR